MKKEGINMVYTSTMELPTKQEDSNYIFLAGSIDLHLSGNWRQNIIDKLGHQTHFFDPTHTNHNGLDDLEMEKHIKWELDALEIADKIVLHFLPDSESPISLVELGLYTFTDKLMVICPKEFHKYQYVRVLCNKYNTPFFDNIDQTIYCL